jgi:Fe-S-cluster containining protein
MRTHTLSPLARPAIQAIWIAAAARIGLRVERTADAYACSDGEGRIQIGDDNLLDVDDAVAQLIFHELCHALVEGDAGWARPDWGLDNSGAGDVTREHACLRLQIYLASPHDLRAPMAPTTEYRDYYDRLPVDALADDGDPAVAPARAAAARAAAAPWREAIEQALALTAAQLRAAAEVDEAPGNPLGLGVGPAGETCGSCAWRYLGGRGPAVLRCRQSAGPDGAGRRTSDEAPACARWEAPVDCHRCGACCREAYHSVTVSMRDPVVWRQPALIMRQGPRFEIRRDGDRCAALAVERPHDPPPARDAAPPDARQFRCSIYADRPQACRDFEAGGRHCLDARRRVGLSR